MKKILSMLVLCALLLTTLGIAASAATFYDYGVSAGDTKITVKKSNSVVIDGKISAGEYEEYKNGATYTEWYVGENAADYFNEAEAMAKSSKWYFSWDGKYLNIAVQFDAGPGANQTFAAGDYYGDYAYSGTDDFVAADNFFGYGPGLNVVSAEASKTSDYFGRLFVAISENTATGNKLTGMYSDQNGQNQDYFPPHNDFEFVLNGTVVTVEYKIPVIELSETFKENVGNQMFKASISAITGIATADTVAEGVDPAVYTWGVRLGQLGYACDQSNTEKAHATFRLVDESIANVGPVVTPDPTPVPTPTPTPTPTPGEDTPVVTPGDDTPVVTPGEDTPVVTPGEDTPVVTPGEDTPVVTPGNDTPVVAPNTGDIMVVAAVVSAISACGVMIAKKRK